MLLAPSSRQADIKGSQELNTQNRDKILSNSMSVRADKKKTNKTPHYIIMFH